MLGLSVYTIIMILCGLVILSYVFSLISEKTRIPTVLFLLFLGIGIREVLMHYGVYVPLPDQAIEFIGIFGLILILLEAGLDINVSREKLTLIRNAAASSLFVLVLSLSSIAAIVHYALEQSWLVSLVYAVPLSIISSSIVASSIHSLSEVKREFLTYESALSDIIGILLFNYLIADEVFTVHSSFITVAGIVFAVVASVLASILLLLLLTWVKINIKVYLMFASLLLLYGAGHSLHMPSLLVVLVFGLIINNWHKVHHRLAERFLPNQVVGEAAYSFKALTAESAFLVRTFFFTLFGYTIDVRMLGNHNVILVGTSIVLALFLVRYLYLRLFMTRHVLPELFYAPRGLVTIVLFYRIPQDLQIANFDEGILFYVVMATTILMMVGSIFFTPHEATRKSEEEKAQLEELFVPVEEPPEDTATDSHP